MTEDIKNKLENIAITTLMIPLIPAIFVFGLSAYLICKYVLDENDKYEIFKK